MQDLKPCTKCRHGTQYYPSTLCIQCMHDAELIAEILDELRRRALARMRQNENE